jgi:hypothetical protein
MSHGDHGHSVESIVNLLSESSKHLFFMFMDEMMWLLLGEKSERLNQVFSDGNVPVILQAFGEKAPRQEIEADYYGACLLKRAGKDPILMGKTLLKLHGASSSDIEAWVSNQKSQTNRESGEGGVRKYPNLQERLKASKC